MDETRLDQIRALSRDDARDLLGETITRSLDAGPAQPAILRAAAQVGDASRIGEVARTLKAASTNLGATRFSELCRQLDMVGQAGRLGRAVIVVAKLEQHFSRMHNALGALPNARTG